MLDAARRGARSCAGRSRRSARSPSVAALGGAPRATPRDGPWRGRLAGPGRRPDAVRARVPAADGGRGAAHARAAALPERESLELLRAAGLAVDAGHRRRRDAGCGRGGAPTRSAMPVALKLDASALAHKSDIGAVRLGLVGDEAVRGGRRRAARCGPPARRATRPRPPRGADGATRRVELIVGLERDPPFGPACSSASAASSPRSLDDVAIRLAPVEPRRARSRCSTSCAAPAARRGRAAGRQSTAAAVAESSSAVGRLGIDAPGHRRRSTSIRSSPRADGAMAVDALVVLAGSRPATDA